MIKKITSFILFLPLFLVLSFVPLNKRVWVFGSWRGEKYSDNSKYLLEFIKENYADKIRPVWLTRNKLILDKLKKDGKECYLFYSIKGAYYGLISGVLVMSTSWIDLPFYAFLKRNKKLVQLWHGTPLRKLNLKSGSFKKRLLRNLFILYLGREYDMIAAATKKNIEILSLKNRFNVDAKYIKVTGQPRNDILFERSKNKSFLKKKYKEKIFLYLPTWRKYKHDLFDKGYDFDPKKINDFLIKNNSYLVIKVHYNEFEKYKKVTQAWEKNKRILLSFVDDIYPFLPNVDVLLTDYSSVFFDYLLLDKPIVFMPFDMSEYSRDNGGFYYDYNSITPGPKARNWEDVMIFLKEIIEGEDSYKDKRKEINKMFNKFQDVRSSERVYMEIQKLCQ